MLPRIGDVVAHACEPFERVQGLEVSSERRVHPRAVEHGLAAVEVDELLEGEGVSDEVGGGVLETLLVEDRDRFAHVSREAGMPPGEELRWWSREVPG
jgi:hypothetical protein